MGNVTVVNGLCEMLAKLRAKDPKAFDAIARLFHRTVEKKSLKR